MNRIVCVLSYDLQRLVEQRTAESTDPLALLGLIRYVPEDLRSTLGEEPIERYLNDLNEALLDRVQRSGEAFVSNAVVHGRYVLRACIVNFHTERQDVGALLEIVERFGRKLDRERRPASMN